VVILLILTLLHALPLRADSMKQLTKTQIKNALRAIQNKATQLALRGKGVMTIEDCGAINRILTKADNRLKKM
jgi:translation initiation factor 2B subunit (eIF-2B alpha/beta/delta family)